MSDAFLDMGLFDEMFDSSYTLQTVDGDAVALDAAYDDAAARRCAVWPASGGELIGGEAYGGLTHQVCLQRVQPGVLSGLHLIVEPDEAPAGVPGLVIGARRFEILAVGHAFGNTYTLLQVRQLPA